MTTNKEFLLEHLDSEKHSQYEKENNIVIKSDPSGCRKYDYLAYCSEKLRQIKVNCECGTKYQYVNYKTHIKSNRHKEYCIFIKK